MGSSDIWGAGDHPTRQHDGRCARRRQSRPAGDIVTNVARTLPDGTPPSTSTSSPMLDIDALRAYAKAQRHVCAGRGDLQLQQSAAGRARLRRHGERHEYHAGGHHTRDTVVHRLRRRHHPRRCRQRRKRRLQWVAVRQRRPLDQRQLPDERLRLCPERHQLSRHRFRRIDRGDAQPEHPGYVVHQHRLRSHRQCHHRLQLQEGQDGRRDDQGQVDAQGRSYKEVSGS